MYWARNSDQEGLLDKFISLGRDGLEKLLDLDCVILRVKNGDERLLQYLTQVEMLKTLLGYVCGRGLHGEEALRYPLVACEILCTDQSTLLTALRQNQAVLQELWAVPRDDVPPLLVCWTRLVNFLLGKLPHEMALALQNAPSKEDGSSEFLGIVCERAHLNEVCDVFYKVLALSAGHPASGTKDGPLLLNWILEDNNFFKEALMTFDGNPMAISQLFQGMFAFPHSEDFPTTRILASIIDGLEGTVVENFAEYSTASRRFASFADLLGMIVNRLAMVYLKDSEATIPRLWGKLGDLMLPHIPQIRNILGMTLPETYQSPSGPIKPVGLVRLKAAQISADLLLLRDERIATAFIELGIPGLMLELFFLHSQNNLLHGVVVDFVQRVLDDVAFDNYRALIIALLKQGRLLNRLVKTQRINDATILKPRGCRLAIMGHVTVITDEIIALLERCDEHIREEIGGELNNEDWLEYVEQAHRETKIKNGLVMGGAKAPPPAESEESVTDGIADSYNALFATGTDEALARYFCQQVIASLPNRFVFHDNGFDEDGYENEDGVGLAGDRCPWDDDEEDDEEHYEPGEVHFIGAEEAPSIAIPVEPNGFDTVLEMEMKLSSLGEFSGDSLSGSDDGEVWDPHFERRGRAKTPDRDPNRLTLATEDPPSPH